MGPGLGPFFAHDYRGANQNGPNTVTVKTIHFLYLTHETIHFLYCSIVGVLMLRVSRVCMCVGLLRLLEGWLLRL